MAKCANCGTGILFGKKLEDKSFCNDICLENYCHPGFCPDCVAETTDESPGGTTTFNGIGTRLYGGAGKCPTCYSVLKRKWFCILFIPIVPLGNYRIKPVTVNRYLGRSISPQAMHQSRLRVSSVSK